MGRRWGREKERREGKTNLELLLSSLESRQSLIVDGLVLEISDVGLLLNLESLVVRLRRLGFLGSSVSLDLLDVGEFLDRILENLGLVLLLLLENLDDSLSVLVCRRDIRKRSSQFESRAPKNENERRDEEETHTRPCES